MAIRTLPSPLRRVDTAAPGNVAVVTFNDDWEQIRDHTLACGATAAEALVRVRTDGDPWLLALVARAQQGEQLAGRVVVQAVVRLLAKMARGDERLTVNDLVSALWVRIAVYPVDRRVTSVVANLVLDAKKDVLAEARPLRPLGTPDETGVSARALLVEATELAIISEDLRVALDAVYVEGLTSEEAGRHLGLTATTVRWRCSVGRRRLAAAKNRLAA